MEHLTPVIFTVESSDILTAGINGAYSLVLSHNGKTTEGNDVHSGSDKIQIICDVYCNGEVNQYTGDAPLTVELPFGNDYSITTKASCVNYLSSNALTSSDLHVIHSPQFFVSSEGSDEDGNGTVIHPYQTFNTAITAIKNYKDDMLSQCGFEPESGYFINVLSDFDSVTADYLLNRKLISNNGFTGTMTIRGVDENLTAVKRTIDLQNASSVSNRSAIYWTDTGDTTLNLENLIVSGSDNGGIQFEGENGNELTTTLKNCDITNNSSASNGGGIKCSYSSGSYGQITINDCTISANSTSNSSFDGGGLYVWTQDDSPVTTVLNRCTINGNTAGGQGGGIFFYASGESQTSTFTVNSCTLTGNTSNDSGGGIESYNRNDSPDVKFIIKGDTTITGNTTHNYFGGGVYCESTLYLGPGNITITDNTTLQGQGTDVYLETGHTMVIIGKLTGSTIGVGLAERISDIKPTAGNPVQFITYESSCKPSSGELICSNSDYDINFGSTNAFLELAVTLPGTIATKQFGDITLSIEMDAENTNQELGIIAIKFTFTNSSGNVITPSSFNLAVKNGMDSISSGSDTWIKQGNSMIIYNTYACNTILYDFTYNGDTYSGSMPTQLQ